MTNRKKQAVIRHLTKGESSSQIAKKLSLTRQQVAAVKAHLEMCTYDSVYPELVMAYTESQVGPCGTGPYPK